MRLPLLTDMTPAGHMTDELQCIARKREKPDDEDIEYEANCLINDILYSGFGEESKE